MKYALHAVLILLASACGGDAKWQQDSVGATHYDILAADRELPSGCKSVGLVSVPKREVHPSARYVGTAYREFSLSLSRQVEALGGNLIVPTGDVGFDTALEWGESFTAAAYHCPAS